MKKYITIIFLVSGIFFCGCKDVLEKEYLSAISPTDVYNDINLATAYVDMTYASLMPGWPNGEGSASDEAYLENLNSFQNGTADIDAYNNWQYTNIRTINIFLESINSGSIAEGADKDALIGQMLFFRAYAYFVMVRAYGGVPLILKPQDAFGDEDIFVSRNKTSECFAQIEKDLTDAANLLPDSWTKTDVGRIDKGAALAFKGRVLLFWASPQFNPSGAQDRWQKAYEANKTAVNFLTGIGKGLYANFENIWQDELNKEVIMVRRYHEPGFKTDQRGIRPTDYSQGASNSDRPALQLVNAFPMADGSVFDPSGGYAGFHLNRDKRFYATIGYNGTDLALADMVAIGTYLWTYNRPNNGGSVEGKFPTPSGFYRKKGLDKNVDQGTANLATVDWIEIRFAEVLMNYGEAANEIGQTSEAMDVLRQIRSRAGILAGTGNNYGIQTTDKENLREVYINERFVEFAFEGKRWWQIRRQRLFDDLNAMTRRSGLKITLIEGEYAPSVKDDIDLYINNFTYEVVDIDNENFNLLDEYYFYAIPRSHLEQNGNLEQTQGWPAGTFDPLL